MQKKRTWSQLFCDCSGTRRRRRGDCCLQVTNIPINKPDLAIYSQDEEVSFGRQPTWDNPDITTNLWGPFRLMESVQVRITNRSEKTNAANGLVNLYMGPFGIGMPFRLSSIQRVNILRGNAIDLSFPLEESLRVGDTQRLSFKVVTQHPYDPNPINNQGSQCIDGRHTSLAGRHFTVDIPVRNPHPTARRRINLQVFPGELGASIDWNTFEFAPLEEKVVHLAITVPGGFRETDDSSTKPHVTVLATHTSGQLLGGASIITKVDS
jgi:hypothetical protein